VAQATKEGERRFVVQRHRARRLHYDFRLEIDGVLVSWAVPRGLTLDPSVRRAAFHVDDHPMSYFDFEGVIPSGQYGGGDVIVWDAGVWRPYKEEESDPASAVARGELHMELFGEKLRGKFVLVRTKAGPSGKEDWLLLHKRDEHAIDGWDPEDYPRSVLSGRTNDEVKADPDRLWRSDLPADQASIKLKVSAAELAELDALKASGSWDIFGRTLRVTNLDKVLFPARAGEDPVTKREFLRYAAQIAPVAVPYLAKRALNLHRFPEGAQSKGVWQKRLPDRAPSWLPRWENHLVVDEPAALIWAANFSALEWHPWTSRIDNPDLPTYVLIDLDPAAETSWEDLLTLARLHRTAFEHLRIKARASVTGRRGIHIWVPIKPGPSFNETREWAKQLSKTVGAVVPELAGLAPLDYTPNALGKTLVAPYSPRPAAGAPVSVPIDWSELDDPELTPDRFTIRGLPERLAAKGDLFQDVLNYPQDLPRLT
jgi:bifunctional non-homologous end joining protein LigD